MIDRTRQSGFSLAEMLVVVALAGIVIAIGIPLVNEQIRIAEVRAAADDMALHMRAARMIAVTQHRTVNFVVLATPTNEFRYDKKAAGVYDKVITMPSRVRIESGSDASINFKADGSVDFLSAVVLESNVSNKLERWTITVNTMGLTKLAHERI